MRVCAGWSKPLLVAHTTLLEISCPGSFGDNGSNKDASRKHLSLLAKHREDKIVDILLISMQTFIFRYFNEYTCIYMRWVSLNENLFHENNKGID